MNDFNFYGVVWVIVFQLFLYFGQGFGFYIVNVNNDIFFCQFCIVCVIIGCYVVDVYVFYCIKIEVFSYFVGYFVNKYIKDVLLYYVVVLKVVYYFVY